jgi:hypothetical protein
MAAEAFFLFLDKKKQKSSQQEMLLCRTGPLPCKSGKTSGCKILPAVAPTRPALQQKITIPLPLHTVRQFYLISPEADLLTFVLHWESVLA